MSLLTIGCSPVGDAGVGTASSTTQKAATIQPTTDSAGSSGTGEPTTATATTPARVRLQALLIGDTSPQFGRLEHKLRRRTARLGRVRVRPREAAFDHAFMNLGAPVPASPFGGPSPVARRPRVHAVK